MCQHKDEYEYDYNDPKGSHKDREEDCLARCHARAARLGGRVMRCEYDTHTWWLGFFDPECNIDICLDKPRRMMTDTDMQVEPNDLGQPITPVVVAVVLLFLLVAKMVQVVFLRPTKHAALSEVVTSFADNADDKFQDATEKRLEA